MSRESLAEVANAAHIFLHNQAKIDGLREAIAAHDAEAQEAARGASESRAKAAAKAKTKA